MSAVALPPPSRPEPPGSPPTLGLVLRGLIPFGLKLSTPEGLQQLLRRHRTHGARLVHDAARAEAERLTQGGQGRDVPSQRLVHAGEHRVIGEEGQLAERACEQVGGRLVAGSAQDEPLEDLDDRPRVRVQARQQHQHELLQPARELVLLKQLHKGLYDRERLRLQRRLLERHGERRDHLAPPPLRHRAVGFKHAEQLVQRVQSDRLAPRPSRGATRAAAGAESRGASWRWHQCTARAACSCP